MHTQEQIAQEVRKFLIDNIFGGTENPELREDTPLISTRLMDSIVALKLVSHVEALFGIEFQAHEVVQDNLENINAIVAFVQRKQK